MKGKVCISISFGLHEVNMEVTTGAGNKNVSSQFVSLATDSATNTIYTISSVDHKLNLAYTYF